MSGPGTPGVEAPVATAARAKLLEAVSEATAAWSELVKAINAAGHAPTSGNFLAVGFKAACFAGLYDDLVRAAGVEVD